MLSYAVDVAVVAASAPERPVYKVHYEDDEEEEELEEEEIRPLLVIDGLIVHAPAPARVHKRHC